jgi:hypothetical protein
MVRVGNPVKLKKIIKKQWDFNILW